MTTTLTSSATPPTHTEAGDAVYPDEFYPDAVYPSATDGVIEVPDWPQTITPELVLGYASSRPVYNTIHTVLGRSDPAITFKAAGLRTGTLKIFCTTNEIALQIEAMHAAIGFITLVNDETPGLNMRYVPTGSIDVELDDDTRKRWTVSVGYQEVAASA